MKRRTGKDESGILRQKCSWESGSHRPFRTTDLQFGHPETGNVLPLCRKVICNTGNPVYITGNNNDMITADASRKMNDSIISEELRKRLHGCVQTAEQEYTCTITFDPEFTGFQGHFEGNPIMPGVCLIELARVHAETALGSQLKTKEIGQCRFRAPVLAGMTADCKLRVRKLDDTHVRLQSEIRTGGNVACQVSIKAEIVS